MPPGRYRQAVTQPPSDWTDGYFDELYLELFGFPDAERTDVEITALRTLLPDPPARVLDAACGVGRHAIRLAAAGYDVVGLDSSDLFLERARAARRMPGLRSTSCTATSGRSRTSPTSTPSSTSTPRGATTTTPRTSARCSRWRTRLRPGGLFVLEIAHRDSLVGRYTPHDWSEMSDGTLVVQLREFDAVAGVNTVTHRWQGPRRGAARTHAPAPRVHRDRDRPHAARRGPGSAGLVCELHPAAAHVRRPSPRRRGKRWRFVTLTFHFATFWRAT